MVNKRFPIFFHNKTCLDIWNNLFCSFVVITFRFTKSKAIKRIILVVWTKLAKIMTLLNIIASDIISSLRSFKNISGIPWCLQPIMNDLKRFKKCHVKNILYRISCQVKCSLNTCCILLSHISSEISLRSHWLAVEL